MALENEAERRLSKQPSLASETYVVKALPPVMKTLDMTAFFVMIVFFITNSNTAVTAGPAAFTYLLVGALAFFLPSVIVTAQLGSMFPHEGALYNWTHRAFGGYWSFFAAFCAWFPGVLVMVSAADDVMAYLQGLNSHWLLHPWQQGLVIIALLLFSGLLALQRFRTVLNVIVIAAGAIFVGVLLLGLACLCWLLGGHPSATDFSAPQNWLPARSNIAIFGLVILAYLGVEAPLNMGGEIAGRKVVTRHLLWGALLVLGGYFIASWALLVIEGPTKGALLSALISAADAGLGSVAGDIVALCIMIFFLVAAVAYNCSYARLLLVAGIDQRLPLNFGKLNKWRVPANAIILQTIAAALLAALIFIVMPLVFPIESPRNLATEVYNVMLASSTLIWAISAAFLFLNLLAFYLRDRQALRARLIFPAPLIWLCVTLGVAASVFAIIDSLTFSWTALIPASSWWYIVGSVTLLCLIIAAIASMFAISEAAWQELRE